LISESGRWPLWQGLPRYRDYKLFRFPANRPGRERTRSDLVNQAYGLTQAEIELLRQTAPRRMPIPPPATAPQAPVKEMAGPDPARLAC